MSRIPAPRYSELDLKGAYTYTLRFEVEEWACVAELLTDAPYDINDQARDALEAWSKNIAEAYDIEPRRVVLFEAPQSWADYLWYVLTLPSACELEDMARKMRTQVRRRNSHVKRRNREQYWESLRTRR